MERHHNSGSSIRVWLLLRFLRATKMNDLDLHITCLQQLCPLLFSMDHHNYARYLTVYFISLLNLSDSHPGAESLLRNDGFSVCRSDVPASRTAVDLRLNKPLTGTPKQEVVLLASAEACQLITDGL